MPTASDIARSAALGIGAVASTAGGGWAYAQRASTAPPIRSLPPDQESAGGPLMVTQEVLDARLDAIEARVELRLADKLSSLGDQIAALASRIGGLDTKIGTETQALAVKIDAKPGTWKVVASIVGSVFAAALGGLAIAAFGGDRFDGGMSAAGAVAAQTTETAEREQRLNNKMDCILSRQGDPKAVCK